MNECLNIDGIRGVLQTFSRSYDTEIYIAALFYLVNVSCSFLFSIFSKDYNKLKSIDKIEYISRVVSNINALVCTLGAAYCLFFEFENTWSKTPFYETTRASEFFLKFIWSYFLYDTVLLCFHRNLMDWGTMAHHLLGLALYNIGIACGTCHFVLMAFVFTEITTPFVNYRWILYQTGRKDSQLYVINGLLLALGFLFFRVLLVPYIIGNQIFPKYELSLSLPSYIWYGTYVGYFAMNLLNVFWATLIWKGLLRVVFQQKPKPTPENKSK